jgi:hypothetical protein
MLASMGRGVVVEVLSRKGTILLYLGDGATIRRHWCYNGRWKCFHLWTKMLHRSTMMLHRLMAEVLRMADGDAANGQR